MKLLLKREPSTRLSTPGVMTVEGLWEAYTLEDPVIADPNPETPANEAKIPGRTAIPAGEYKIVISYSNHFKKYLPLLLNTPGFDGVRIHSGNTSEDTEGCILLGEHRANPDLITGSRTAFAKVFDKIRAAIERKENVSIEIVDAEKVKAVTA